MADIQFNLRIPEELKEKIKQAATESGRSINAEAQYRLEQSFELPRSINMEKVLRFIDAVNALERIEKLEKELDSLKKIE
ncbi:MULTISPECIES: Arc family DNA-binding protein [Acinetobacter]|uniref:DNA-binding protein n=5 Tax=Acinetobacter calcoaceticus/baumannii complex TaxID=909768 RepID=A0A0K8YEG8_ACIBA|nr:MULTISPECIES: Arc family DNA-binding protein [Acinetobacter]ADX03190.1 Arc domain protein DNA binding domain rotein [Acinetobacter baumannii 1656-2]AEP06799.1 Arc family DNA-binding protein [Acinetobacter baumannii MDR-ZJ06]AGQ13954.1 hypothetical protein BJAB07104_01586 [Acinetobacter baumannii BJAB07104]ANB88394.1 DNA-binding protein [Acinetobacter baumannii]AOP64144.1 hypothetical protein DU202_02989 [Acinetobacter baumannii DU202]